MVCCPWQLDHPGHFRFLSIYKREAHHGSLYISSGALLLLWLIFIPVSIICANMAPILMALGQNEELSQGTVLVGAAPHCARLHWLQNP
jgi:hypothetical protein